MEPAIPPKPSAWQGFSRKYLKWAGLGLLLLTLASLLVLWRRDKQRIEQLSKQIAIAQQQVQQLSASKSAMEMPPITTTETGEPSTAQTSVSKNNDLPSATNGNGSSFAATTNGSRQQVQSKAGPTVGKQQSIGSIAPNPNSSNPVNRQGEPLAPASTNFVDNQSVVNAPSANNSMAEAVAPVLPTTENTVLAVENLAAQPVQESANVAALPTSISCVSFIKNQAPSVKHQGIRPYRKPYPRISVEVGSAAFAMPLARLFNRDTNYAGSVRPSWSANFALHYELSPTFALHGGYELKNIRTSKMALRYHSVPMLVAKKMMLGRRLGIEAKAGLTVNRFFNYRTYSDGLSIRGRKDFWLGWQASAQIGTPISKDILLLVGPYGGSALTTFANSKRTWEAGLAANIRYQF